MRLRLTRIMQAAIDGHAARSKLVPKRYFPLLFKALRFSPPDRRTHLINTSVQGCAHVPASTYNAHQADWTADSPNVQKIAALTGANAHDIPELLQGAHFPSTQEQKSARLLGGGTAKDLAQTAAFLKDQGKIESVSADYSGFVSDQYLPD